MTYLEVCGMCVSQLNNDPVVLSMKKLENVFNHYGVLAHAQQPIPVDDMAGILGPGDKMAMLERLIRRVFENAGENYPILDMGGCIEVGKVIYSGIEKAQS